MGTAHARTHARTHRYARLRVLAGRTCGVRRLLTRQQSPSQALPCRHCRRRGLGSGSAPSTRGLRIEGPLLPPRLRHPCCVRPCRCRCSRTRRPSCPTAARSWGPVPRAACRNGASAAASPRGGHLAARWAARRCGACAQARLPVCAALGALCGLHCMPLLCTLLDSAPCNRRPSHAWLAALLTVLPTRPLHPAVAQRARSRACAICKHSTRRCVSRCACVQCSLVRACDL